MNTLSILIVSGLFTGSIYSLMAIGYVVVYKSTKVLNFSQGMLVVMGSYLLWSALSVGMPVWLSIILAFACAMGLSIFIERVCMRPLIGQPILASVMVTLALIGGLRGLVLLIWGPNRKTFPVNIIPRGAWDLMVVSLPKEKAMALLAAITIIILLYLFFRYTRFGLGMKVTSEDHTIAQIVGVNINQIFSTSWAITGLVATIGGLFLGTIINIHPELEEIGLKALAAMLLGGLESIPGAFIGGLIIGLTETISGEYLHTILGPSIGGVFPYILIILVLMVRPYGIFGWRKIERV